MLQLRYHFASCTESSFGGDNWDADLLIDRTETEISIHASKEVIDWCWRNGLLPASGEEQRQWLYKRHPLPAPEAYRKYLSSRDAYDERLNQARVGY